MSISVRRLKPDEAALFRALRVAARASDPDAFRGTLEQETGKPIEWFVERLIGDPVFGAFDDAGGLIGMAGFTPGGGTRDGLQGRVWSVYVQPRRRGERVGEAVMLGVIGYARGLVNVLHLSVMADNVAARRLYERMGFVFTGLERDVSPTGAGKLRDEALYELALTQPSA